MPIKYEITPKFTTRTYEAVSKQLALFSSLPGTNTFSSRGFGALKREIRANADPNYVYLYHAEKRRKVVKVGKKYIDGKPNRKVIKTAHWVITIYTVPIENVKVAKQYSRHFDLVLKG